MINEFVRGLQAVVLGLGQVGGNGLSPGGKEAFLYCNQGSSEVCVVTIPDDQIAMLTLGGHVIGATSLFGQETDLEMDWLIGPDGNLVEGVGANGNLSKIDADRLAKAFGQGLIGFGLMNEHGARVLNKNLLKDGTGDVSVDVGLFFDLEYLPGSTEPVARSMGGSVMVGEVQIADVELRETFGMSLEGVDSNANYADAIGQLNERLMLVPLAFNEEQNAILEQNPGWRLRARVEGQEVEIEGIVALNGEMLLYEWQGQWITPEAQMIVGRAGGAEIVAEGKELVIGDQLKFIGMARANEEGKVEVARKSPDGSWETGWYDTEGAYFEFGGQALNWEVGTDGQGHWQDLMPAWGGELLLEVSQLEAKDNTTYNLDGRSLMYGRLREVATLEGEELVFADPETGAEVRASREAIVVTSAVEMVGVHEDGVHIGANKEVVSILVTDEAMSERAGFPWVTYMYQEGVWYRVPEPIAGQLAREMPEGLSPAEMSAFIRAQMPETWQEAPLVAYEASEHYLAQNYYLVKQLMAKMGWPEEASEADRLPGYAPSWQGMPMPAIMGGMKQGFPIGVQPSYLSAGNGVLGVITPLGWARILKEGRELVTLSLPATIEGVRQMDGSLYNPYLNFNLTFDPVAQARLLAGSERGRTFERVWTDIKAGTRQMTMEVLTGADSISKQEEIEWGWDGRTYTKLYEIFNYDTYNPFLEFARQMGYGALVRAGEANNGRLSGCVWMSVDGKDLCLTDEQKDINYGWILTLLAVRGSRFDGYAVIKEEDILTFQQFLVPTIWAEDY